MLELLNSHESTRQLPTAAKTLCASVAAAGWRIFLMPIDTTKTIMQVEVSPCVACTRNLARPCRV